MDSIKTAYLTGKIRAMTKLGFQLPPNTLRNALVGAGVGGLGGLLTADEGEGLSHTLGGALLGAGLGAGGTAGYHHFAGKPGAGKKLIGVGAPNGAQAAPTRAYGAATTPMSVHQIPTREINAYPTQVMDTSPTATMPTQRSRMMAALAQAIDENAALGRMQMGQ